MKSVRLGRIALWSLAAAIARCADAEETLERRELPLHLTTGHLYSAESSVRLEPAAGGEAPTLRWSVVVDHHGGEAAYPVGWPRFGIRLPPEWRDWSGWERLRVRWRAEGTRERWPERAVGVQVYAPDKASANTEWWSVSADSGWRDWWLDLDRLADLAHVARIQWHVAESEYRHGERVDVWIASIALERYAQPTVVETRVGHGWVWADARAVLGSVRLAGLRPGATATVICEVAREGRVLAKRTAVLGRGAWRLSVPAPPGGFGEGAAEWIVRMTDSTQAVTAAVRFVASPWEAPR
ncbi:MAG: hypothetical protein N2652_02465 [Kiritimatiellae bacterium]|nr:hypothetical protein [Kiritimatiellia bacterium]